MDGFQSALFRYGDLRRYAEKFLAQYHPGRKVPVPIEEIIDVRLGIDIVPMPGLGNFDTVAYLSPDLAEIRVDEFVYKHRPNRYRFSLAHELGHRILHADIFRQFRFSNVASWKRFITDEIPLDQYRYLESQANGFAGLVLVPAQNFERGSSIMSKRHKNTGLTSWNRAPAPVKQRRNTWQ